MTELVLLGTGNGKADPERFSPASVIWLGGEPVLVDCGNGALLRLRAAGIAPGSIRTVLPHAPALRPLLGLPVSGHRAADRRGGVRARQPHRFRAARDRAAGSSLRARLRRERRLRGARGLRARARAVPLERRRDPRGLVDHDQRLAGVRANGRPRRRPPALLCVSDSTGPTDGRSRSAATRCPAMRWRNWRTASTCSCTSATSRTRRSRPGSGSGSPGTSTAPRAASARSRAPRGEAAGAQSLRRLERLLRGARAIRLGAIAPAIISRDYDGEIIVGRDLMRLEL